MEEVRKKVEKICSDEMKVKVEVTYERHLSSKSDNGQMWLIKMKNFEDKIQILKNKKKLGKKALYFESDLTKTERDIQWQLRRKAESERQKGNKIKIGYQKIQVNNEWVKWDKNSTNQKEF